MSTSEIMRYRVLSCLRFLYCCVSESYTLAVQHLSQETFLINIEGQLRGKAEVDLATRLRMCAPGGFST